MKEQKESQGKIYVGALRYAFECRVQPDVHGGRKQPEKCDDKHPVSPALDSTTHSDHVTRLKKMTMALLSSYIINSNNDG
jgi:hypothetical protein